MRTTSKWQPPRERIGIAMAVAMAMTVARARTRAMHGVAWDRTDNARIELVNPSVTYEIGLRCYFLLSAYLVRDGWSHKVHFLLYRPPSSIRHVRDRPKVLLSTLSLSRT